MNSEAVQVPGLIKLEVVEGRGRCVVASRDIAAGEVIMRSHPASCTVLGHMRGERCSWCLSKAPTDPATGEVLPGKELKRCSGCKEAWYCSGKKCQRHHWSAHKAMCKAWQKKGGLASLSLPDAAISDFEMLAEICSKSMAPAPAAAAAAAAASAVGAVASPTPPLFALATSRATVDALESHKSEMKAAHPKLFEQLRKTAALAASVDLGQGVADASALLEHLCRFHCNNFGIVTPLFNPEGAGCYPWGALLNHGCNGNCVLTYAPDHATGRPHQVIRCIDPVVAGGELVHAYCDAILPLEARQSQIKKDYFFECNCNRCLQQMSPGGSDGAGGDDPAAGKYRADALWGLINHGVPPPWSSPIAKRASPEQLRATAGQISRQATEAAGEPESVPQYGAVLGYLLAAGADPLTDPSVVETLNALVDDSLIAGRSEVAGASLTWILACYRAAYPPSHPMIGLQLFLLGDVMLELSGQGGTAVKDLTADNEFVMVDWRKKRATARAEAKVALSASHGADHAMVAMLA
eukprot:gene1163-12050_t